MSAKTLTDMQYAADIVVCHANSIGLDITADVLVSTLKPAHLDAIITHEKLQLYNPRVVSPKRGAAAGPSAEENVRDFLEVAAAITDAGLRGDLSTPTLPGPHGGVDPCFTVSPFTGRPDPKALMNLMLNRLIGRKGGRGLATTEVRSKLQRAIAASLYHQSPQFGKMLALPLANGAKLYIENALKTPNRETGGLTQLYIILRDNPLPKLDSDEQALLDGEDVLDDMKTAPDPDFDQAITTCGKKAYNQLAFAKILTRLILNGKFGEINVDSAQTKLQVTAWSQEVDEQDPARGSVAKNVADAVAAELSPAETKTLLHTAAENVEADEVAVPGKVLRGSYGLKKKIFHELTQRFQTPDTDEDSDVDRDFETDDDTDESASDISDVTSASSGGTYGGLLEGTEGPASYYADLGPAPGIDPNTTWDQLELQQRSTAKKLGWDETSWTEYTPPAAYRLPWKELGEETQLLAQTLGSSPQQWDSDHAQWLDRRIQRSLRSNSTPG